MREKENMTKVKQERVAVSKKMKEIEGHGTALQTLLHRHTEGRYRSVEAKRRHKTGRNSKETNQIIYERRRRTRRPD